MACSSGHCSYNNTGTTTCSYHKGTNWASPVGLSGNFQQGGLVTASDVTTLLYYVNDALNNYNNWLTTYGYPALNRAGYGMTTGSIINSADLNNSENVAAAGLATTFGGYDSAPGTPAYNVSSGAIIRFSDWQDLYNKYSTLVADCICNSNCSCNAVCVCNNDCGCNYSDIRLKENIQYIETRGDLKLYSFTYVWDSVTKYIGVIAQDLLGTKYADAVSQDTNGYYMVNYSKLPI